MLSRGFSMVTTTPELPTSPFNLDRPIERDVKAEGCLEHEKPHDTPISSFNEWTISARMPGSLPPRVGQTLVQVVPWMRLFIGWEQIVQTKKN